MYSNMDLYHARSIMKHWSESYVPEDVTEALPKDTILEALDLVMHHKSQHSGIQRFLLSTASWNFNGNMCSSGVT